MHATTGVCWDKTWKYYQYYYRIIHVENLAQETIPVRNMRVRMCSDETFRTHHNYRSLKHFSERLTSIE
jgi:hypothetical protein